MKNLTLVGLCVAVLAGGCEPSKVELRNRAVSEFQVGHADQAKETFLHVLERYPTDSTSLYYMGRISHAEGSYEEAVYYYQCCLDSDPSHKDAQRYLGEAQEAAGPTGEKLRFIP